MGLSVFLFKLIVLPGKRWPCVSWDLDSARPSFGSSLRAACCRCPLVWNVCGFISAFCVYLRPVVPCGKLKWVFARSLSLATQRHFSRVTDLTLVHPFGTLVQSLLCPYLHFVLKHPLSNRQKHLPTAEGNKVLQLLFPRTKACRSSVQCQVMDAVHLICSLCVTDGCGWLLRSLCRLITIALNVKVSWTPLPSIIPACTYMHA